MNNRECTVANCQFRIAPDSAGSGDQPLVEAGDQQPVEAVQTITAQDRAMARLRGEDNGDA